MSITNRRYMTVIKESEDGQKSLTCIDLDEVNFVDSHHSKIRYFTDNQVYYQITTMSEMDELLGKEGFVPLDRQNLVNLLKVKSFDSEAGKVYFEENPSPDCKFATVAKMKYQLVLTILKRYVAHNNDKTIEVAPSKENKGLKGFLEVFKIVNLLTLAASTVFGTLEVLGTLILSITLFRIPYRSYLLHLLATSILVSIVATLVYDVWDLHFIASELIVAMITYLIIRVAFKTSFWHTFLIFFTGYMTSLMFYAFLYFIGVADANSMINEVISTITVQFYLFIFFILLSISLNRNGWGFVFMSEKMDVRPKYRQLTLVILSTGFFGIVTFLLALYLNVNHLPFYILAFILFLIFLIIFISSIYMLSNKHVEERFTKTNMYKWMN